MKTDLSPLQRRALNVLHKPNLTVHVLTSNEHLCTVLVINANMPSIIERRAYNRTGQEVARFRYRQIPSRVAAAA